MLKSIKLHGVGPVHDLSASLGDRLNIITGDNGLGKSFLLDLTFWSLTGTWPGGRIAIPDRDYKVPSIEVEIHSKTKTTTRQSIYSFKTQAWGRQRGRPPMPGLVVYAAVDGSFAVWDPARNYWRDPHWPKADPELPRAFEFRPESSAEREETGTGSSMRRDVANGLEENGRVLCNGLISDWVEWYYRRSDGPDASPFGILEEVIALLSHPLEPLKCIEPQKVFLDDSRKFPTLRLPYADVPYPQWSAGVRRVVNFAYLIVWAWTEHVQAARLQREEPTHRMVLIFDEIEAHLHPKWQRTILPAVLKVVGRLQPYIALQAFVASHSPLVLASLEPHFDKESDRFFCFNLDAEKPAEERVTFDEIAWAMHGDAVGWLTSDVFGLDQARSKEAERAIECAEAYMRGDVSELPDGFRTHEEISAALRRLLPGLDPFWPRWIVEGKK